MSARESEHVAAGFALCQSCDPPRLIPSAGAVAHLFEFHIGSASEIETVSIKESGDDG